MSELVHESEYRRREGAQIKVFEFIEVF